MKFPPWFTLESHTKVGMCIEIIPYIYWDWKKNKETRNFFFNSNDLGDLKKNSVKENTRLIEDLHLSINGCRFLNVLIAQLISRRPISISSFEDMNLKKFSEHF